MPMAYNLHKAFIPVRKSGKLPRATSRIAYDLEYGSAEIEVHREDITPGMRVVIVDDLIATGGTLEAAVHLVEQLGPGQVLAVAKDYSDAVVIGCDTVVDVNGEVFGKPHGVEDAKRMLRACPVPPIRCTPACA